MYRRELRGDDGVLCLALPGEVRAVSESRRLERGRGAAGERREERAQADARGAQVRDLIELQHGVDAPVVLEDRSHLVGCYGVKAAAERGELDERYVLVLGGELRCVVEAGMVAPLVD